MYSVFFNTFFKFCAWNLCWNYRFYVNLFFLFNGLNVWIWGSVARWLQAKRTTTYLPCNFLFLLRNFLFVVLFSKTHGKIAKFMIISRDCYTLASSLNMLIENINFFHTVYNIKEWRGAFKVITIIKIPSHFIRIEFDLPL